MMNPPSQTSWDHCQLCGSRNVRTAFETSEFAVLRCAQCGLVFRDQRPALTQVRRMYDDDLYVESDLFVNWHRDYDPLSPEVIMFESALDRLVELLPVGNLLDLGCAKGLFLHLARLRGWEVTGVDVSQSMSEYARREFDLDVFTGTLEEAAYPDETFDVVTMWDLVEHLEDPFTLLAEAARILKPGGVVLVLTPNHASLITRVAYLIYHASLHLVRKPLDLIYDYHHNWYFTPETLEAAFQAAGFQGMAHVDGMGAHVSRWQDVVRYPRVLEMGADALDVLADRMGRPYRMIAYARK